MDGRGSVKVCVCCFLEYDKYKKMYVYDTKGERKLNRAKSLRVRGNS